MKKKIIIIFFVLILSIGKERIKAISMSKIKNKIAIRKN